MLFISAIARWKNRTAIFCDCLFYAVRNCIINRHAYNCEKQSSSSCAQFAFGNGNKSADGHAGIVAYAAVLFFSAERAICVVGGK